ncbi:MAG TPA: acyl-CoA dehydrogenase family protein [Candidatus Binataceae bacterium]|nr:acyl-CoA dehydrogenase family protein [Candidatus Binataceae bacterium]
MDQVSAKGSRDGFENCTIIPPEPNLTPAQVIQRARDLVPWLREQALAMEQARRISDEVNARIQAAGIYRILQPRRFGGYEFDLSTYAEVISEITRGDGSTGWVVSFNVAHNWWIAQLPEQGQAEIFSPDGDVRAPIQIGGVGLAKRVDGGWIIDGRWDYTSGCDVSNWLGVICMVPGELPDAPPADIIMALLPNADYRVHDNWFVMGMRASGSKQAIVEQLFVPEQRTLSFSILTHRFTAPGHGVHANPLFRLPLLPIVYVELAAIAVGLAQAAIDAFVDLMSGKRLRQPPFIPLRETRRTQACLGRAVAKLESVRAGMNEIIRRQEARVPRLDSGPPVTDLEIRRDLLLLDELTRLSHECVESCFRGAGSSAIRVGNPLERIFRDSATVQTHYFIDSERTTENFGALSFGLPPYSDL